MSHSTTHETAHPFAVTQGTCFALYAYDIGLSIDLERCRKLLSASESQLKHNRRAPRYFDYHPAPLVVTQEIRPIGVSDHLVEPNVNLVLFDFGGVSVSYTLPFAGSFDAMRSISCALNESAALVDDSRCRVEHLLNNIRETVGKPHFTADLVEDYAIFQVEEYEGTWRADELHLYHAADLARVLRAEPQMLSEQEITDALACRISYSKEDVSIIDWNAALVFDREADDVRAVLEFANMELLELRYLDHQLDDSLDESYAVMARRTWFEKMIPGWAGASVRRISQLQVDGAILFERVSNAPKLLGDQYLARVYRMASQRFHLGEWNASILRKLDTIESIYNQMHNSAASWRLEILEWIIVILIALEMILPFVPGYK